MYLVHQPVTPLQASWRQLQARWRPFQTLGLVVQQEAKLRGPTAYVGCGLHVVALDPAHHVAVKQHVAMSGLAGDAGETRVRVVENQARHAFHVDAEKASAVKESARRGRSCHCKRMGSCPLKPERQREE